MKGIHVYYHLLRGLDESWQVVNVRLSLEEARADIELKHVGKGELKPDGITD